MASSPLAGTSGLRPTPILQMLRKHFLLWAIPTIAFCALSIVYATIGPKKYAATQTLLVRDQLIGGNYAKPGRFESMYSLKSAQESISEIAKNPTVIRKALRNADLESKEARDANWPDDKTIEEYQGAISVSSPGGSEFGKSEMIDLVVRAGSREDALALVKSMTTEIEKQMRAIRQQQAESMVLELSETVRLAENDHEMASVTLKKMEADVGADLGELRSLNNPYSASGSIQNQLNNVKTEIRSAINDHENLKKVQTLLRQAAMNPNSITAAPDEALTLLPALKNFKEGLVKAQLNLSKNLGQYSEQHPRVISAQTEVQEIQYRIANELKSSIRAKEKEVEIAAAKVKRLRHNSDELSKRLERLSLQRVEYDKIFNIVQQRSTSLTKANHELNQMKSFREAAGKVDFVTRIDQAQVGTTPLGLSKRVTVGLGTLFGLMLGMGLVMFVAGGPMIAEPPPLNSSPLNRSGSNGNESAEPLPIADPFGPSPGNRTEFRLATAPVPPAAEAEPANHQIKDERSDRIIELDAALTENNIPDEPTNVARKDNLADKALESPVYEPSRPDAQSDKDFAQNSTDRRRRERVNSRHESRPHPSHYDSAQTDTPKPRDAKVEPIHVGSLSESLSEPQTPLGEAVPTTSEIVIPQGTPEPVDERDALDILNDADDSLTIEGFETPDLEDIDMDSRGPLNELKESDIIQGAESVFSMEENSEPDSMVEELPRRITESSSRPNVVTFGKKPTPLKSPQRQSASSSPQAPSSVDHQANSPNQPDAEGTQPIRLTPRKTTDPIQSAAQLFKQADSQDAENEKSEEPKATDGNPTDIPLPTHESRKVKPITQTLVLGNNSLLQMLEEQQKMKSQKQPEVFQQPEHDEPNAASRPNDSGDDRSRDSSENSVDRGSIFRFPSPDKDETK